MTRIMKSLWVALLPCAILAALILISPQKAQAQCNTADVIPCQTTPPTIAWSDRVSINVCIPGANGKVCCYSVLVSTYTCPSAGGPLVAVGYYFDQICPINCPNCPVADIKTLVAQIRDAIWKSNPLAINGVLAGTTIYTVAYPVCWNSTPDLNGCYNACEPNSPCCYMQSVWGPGIPGRQVSQGSVPVCTPPCTNVCQ